MMFIPKIPAGGEVSVDAINSLIDRANRRIRSAVTSSIQDSRLGIGLTPGRFSEPIYGVLSAFSTDPTKDHRYEFKEVVLDLEGRWVAKPGGIESRADAEFAATIFDAAVELNGIGGLDLNTVVRLVPGEYKSDLHGRVDRDWFFSTTTEVKAFELTQDLIPTGGGELDTTVQGYFLRDQTREPVTFYPPQPSGVERNGFFSLGIGRRAGQYQAGTHGWAQWVDQARQEYVDGRIVWFGEWQIITLYAALIAEVRIYDAVLPAGETGPAQLWWEDWDDEEQVSGDENFAFKNSTYQLQVTNTTGATLQIGEKLIVQFNRDDYRWYPIDTGGQLKHAKVQTGSDWTETNDALPYVDECKLVDADGTNERGDAFRIYLPRRRDDLLDFDPDVYEGDVIPWMYNSEGTPICVGNFLNSKIGDTRIRNQKVTIPTGWQLADGTNGTVDYTGDQGRTPKQRTGAEAVGDTGGLLQFTASRVMTVHNTGAHWSVDEIDESGGGVGGGDFVENRGPFAAVEIIQRIK